MSNYLVGGMQGSGRISTSIHVLGLAALLAASPSYADTSKDLPEAQPLTSSFHWRSTDAKLREFETVDVFKSMVPAPSEDGFSSKFLNFYENLASAQREIDADIAAVHAKAVWDLYIDT